MTTPARPVRRSALDRLRDFGLDEELAVPPKRSALDRLRAMGLEDEASPRVEEAESPLVGTTPATTRELMALGEASGVPLPPRRQALPRGAIAAEPSDVTRVAPKKPPPEAPWTLRPATTSRSAFKAEPGTRKAAELARIAERRRLLVQGLESTLPGALIGGENKLAAAEGFVQAGTLPARLLNRGAAALMGRESPLPPTPAETAAQLDAAGMLPASTKLPFSDVTKYAGLETTRDLSSFLGSLPALTPAFRAAGTVAGPAADLVVGGVETATRSPALARLLQGPLREAGTVGLAMGGMAEAEALAQGRPVREAVTEGAVAGVQGAVIGGLFGLGKPAFKVVQHGLEKSIIEHATRPRVGTIETLPERPGTVDAEGRPIRPEPPRPPAAEPTDALLATMQAARDRVRAEATAAARNVAPRPEPRVVAPVPSVTVEVPPGEVTAPASPPPISALDRLKAMAVEETPPMAVPEPTPRTALERLQQFGGEVPSTHTLTFSDGRKVGIRYRVVDLADLTPSHDAFSFQKNPQYPEGVQGRDYAADRGAQDVVKTRAQGLDPDLALDPSLTPDKGPPIVTPQGIVVAGNERTMLLRRAAQLAPERYASYVEALQQRVPEAVRSGSSARGRPVLVREIVDPTIDTSDPETLRQLNRLSDTPDTKSMRGLDDAASRAVQLRKATGALTHFSETIAPDESLADYLGRASGRAFVEKLVEDQVLAPQELARFVEPKSKALTEDGKLMVRRMMLASTVEDPSVIARAPAGVLQKIEQAVPHIVVARATPEWDIGPQVEGALDLLGEARAKEMDLEELLAQSSMFESGPPDAIARMARFLTREPKKAITEAFRRYGQLAREAAGRGAVDDMFETLAPTAEGSRLVFAAPRRPEGQADFFQAPEAVQSSLFGGQDLTPAPREAATLRQAQRTLNDPREWILARAGKPSPAYKEALAFTRQMQPIRADEAAIRSEAIHGEEAVEPAGERPLEMFGSPSQRPTDPVLGLPGGFGGGSPLAGQVTPTPGLKPTNAPAVIEALAQVVAAAGKVIPMREGRLRNKQYAGVFKVKAQVIRTQQANDISTAAHEVAHALELLLFGKASRQVQKQPGVDAPMRRELRALGKALYGNSRPAAGYLSEGWAEYLRTWITESNPAGRTTAPATVAPTFTHWFERDFATAHPKVWEALDTARDLARRWQRQGALERARQSATDPASPAARLTEAAKTVRGWITKEKWVEMAEPLNQLARAAEESLGRSLSPEEDPYFTTSALRMTHSARTRYMVEHGMIDLAGNKVGPALQDIRSLVRGRRSDFTIYLWARRAIALLNDPRGPRNPGLSLDDATHIVAELGSPAFELAASKVYEWNDGVLTYAAQASDTFRMVVEKVRQADPGDYVPLQREFEALNLRWSKASGATKSSPVQRLTGSGRRIKDIFPVMIAKAEATVRAAHQRLVLDQVIALSEKAEGLGGLVEEVPPDQAPVVSKTIQELLDRINSAIGPAAGANLSGVPGLDLTALAGETLTFFAPVSIPKGGDPIIPVWDEGRLRWFQVDAAMYRTLGSLDIYRLPMVLDWLFGKPARLLRAGTTGLRASFGLLWNPIRDLQTFYANTQSNRNPASLLGSYLGALADVARQRTSLGKGGEYLDTFLRLGGEMAQPLGQDIPHTRRAARRVFEGPVIRTLDPRNWFDWYRDMVQIPESVPRVAELKEVAREIGWTPGQPMTLSQGLQLLLAAKQVTTDFTAAGEFARTMNQVAPFHNAAIQGPRANYRAFRRNPSQFALRVAQLAALSLLLWYTHKDEEWYQALTFQERFQHWHFPLTLGDRTEIIRIPRAFEVGALAAIPEVIAEAWASQDHEAATAWMKELFTLATPNLTPVLLDEAFDQYANRDRYFDRPIVPRGEVGLDPEAQFGEFTSKAAVAAGRTVNVSPRRIEHAVRGVAGPLAGDVLAVSGTGRSGVKREPAAADLPVVGRMFLRHDMQSRQVQQFYDTYDEAERRRLTWKAYLKDGNPGRAAEYLRRHQDEILLVVTAEDAGVAGPLRAAYQQVLKLEQQDRQAATAGNRAGREAITREMRWIAVSALKTARGRALVEGLR